MSSRLPKVVVTHWVHPEVAEFLATFSEPVLNETRETLPAAELEIRCRDAEGLMMFMPDSFGADFLDRCPSLRVVAAALKGYDNFDVAACSERGIVFSIASDLLTVPTAELALALTLGLARNLLTGDRRVRSGKFAGWRPVLYGLGLEGSTVGIVGLGAVGRAFAARLRGFDCRLVANDIDGITRDTKTGPEVDSMSLDKLLEVSDIVALFVPLTDQTRHLIDRQTLRQMKRGSYLVNVCRGSVVDEEAVAESLKARHLSGYAADVFEMEDWFLADRPRQIPPSLLAESERTLFTPHLGSAVDEVRKKIAMEAAMQLKSGLDGNIPPHTLNADAVLAFRR